MTTAVQQPPPPVTPAPTARSVNPTEVGWQFVPQYYTFVNKHPNRLHCFYTKNSTFSHGTEGEDGKPCYGQHEIHNKIMALNYDNCKVFIHSVDAQSSASNGIIIQVVGEMSNKGEPWKKFVQTFFLAEQPNGYFVLNDIFRFLKEESVGDEEDEEEQEPEVEEESVPVPVEEHQPAVETQALAVPIHEAVAAYEPEAPTVTPPTIEREPTPTPPSVVEDSVPEPAAQVNGVNGHHSDAAESVATTEEDEAAVSPAPVAEPPLAAEPEPVTTVPEPSPAPDPTVVLAPVKVPSPAPPPTTAVVAQPPPPEKPSGLRTWATLAASNKKGWGSAIASEAKGASVAAPVTPTPPAPMVNKNVHVPNGARAHMGAGGDGPHPAMQAALSVTTAACFVKSVTENVAEPTMREALTARFGPIKELEIVRSKACAFLEFTAVDAARKAIVASLPVPHGGEGGIRLDGKPAGPNNLPPRIIVETRKERGERPPPRPRGGAPVAGGEGRGALIGGGPGPEGGRGGAQGARGRGSTRGRGGGGPSGPK